MSVWRFSSGGAPTKAPFAHSDACGKRAGRDERLDERPARAVEVPVAAGVEDEVHAGGEVRGPPVEPEDQRRALLLQQERRGPRLKVSVMPEVEAKCIAKIIVDTYKISVSTQ